MVAHEVAGHCILGTGRFSLASMYIKRSPHLGHMSSSIEITSDLVARVYPISQLLSPNIKASSIVDPFSGVAIHDPEFIKKIYSVSHLLQTKRASESLEDMFLVIVWEQRGQINSSRFFPKDDPFDILREFLVNWWFISHTLLLKMSLRFSLHSQ